jgi:hypothetical protein
VASHGLIVMNTQEKLRIVLEEYQNGTFIKRKKIWSHDSFLYPREIQTFHTKNTCFTVLLLIQQLCENGTMRPPRGLCLCLMVHKYV